MKKKEENRVRFLIDKCDVTGKIILDKADMSLILRYQREVGMQDVLKGLDYKNFSGLITKLQKELIQAKRLEFVKKPVAYALYQTWKYFDKEEPER